jgi:hypothetical protein
MRPGGYPAPHDFHATKRRIHRRFAFMGHALGWLLTKMAEQSSSEEERS